MRGAGSTGLVACTSRAIGLAARTKVAQGLERRVKGRGQLGTVASGRMLTLGTGDKEEKGEGELHVKLRESDTGGTKGTIVSDSTVGQCRMFCLLTKAGTMVKSLCNVGKSCPPSAIYIELSLPSLAPSLRRFSKEEFGCHLLLLLPGLVLSRLTTTALVHQRASLDFPAGFPTTHRAVTLPDVGHLYYRCRLSRPHPQLAFTSCLHSIFLCALV